MNQAIADLVKETLDRTVARGINLPAPALTALTEEMGRSFEARERSSTLRLAIREALNGRQGDIPPGDYDIGGTIVTIVSALKVAR